MDTFKERQQLEDLSSKGTAAWQVWLNSGSSASVPSNHRSDPIKAAVLAGSKNL